MGSSRNYVRLVAAADSRGPAHCSWTAAEAPPADAGCEEWEYAAESDLSEEDISAVERLTMPLHLEPLYYR